MAYKKDVKIELTGEEFEIVLLGAMHGMNAVTERSFTEQTVWINRETGERVKKPTKKQLEEGKVSKEVDLEATFKEPVVRYTEKVTGQMIDSSLILNRIHNRNVENGLVELQENPNPKEIELTHE